MGELPSELERVAAVEIRSSRCISISRDLEAAARSALQDNKLLPKKSELGSLSCLKLPKPNAELTGSGDPSTTKFQYADSDKEEFVTLS